MNRVFVPSRSWAPLDEGGQGGRLHLEGDTLHYLAKVLRLRPGDRFVAATEGGPDRICVVEEVERHFLEATVEGERPAAAEAPVRVHLYQGWPKGDKLELIIQKCTELGAATITPVITARSVPRPGAAGKIADKLTRWQAVAREAAEQCGRATIPAVGEPLDIAAAARAMAASGGRAFVLWEGEKATGFLGELEKVPAATTGVALLIGPEGGLSAAEVETLAAAGVMPVGLGSRVLRTETAAIAAVTIVLERLGDLGRVAVGSEP